MENTDTKHVLKDMEYRIQDCIEEALGIATAYQFYKNNQNNSETMCDVLQWGMEVGSDQDNSPINKYLEELVIEVFNRLMNESEKLHMTMTSGKETKQ